MLIAICLCKVAFKVIGMDRVGSFWSGRILSILMLSEALKSLDAAKLQRKTVRVMVETFIIERPKFLMMR